MPERIQKLVLWTFFSSHPLLNVNEFRSMKRFSDEMISLPCHIGPPYAVVMGIQSKSGLLSPIHLGSLLTPGCLIDSSVLALSPDDFFAWS
jgi:hypothetical protein